MFLRKSAASPNAKPAKIDAGGSGKDSPSESAAGGRPPATSPTRVSPGPTARPARPGIPKFPGVAAKSGLVDVPDGAKLVVGSDIRLTGEISHCDVLIIEGRVDAAHSGKYVRITESGQLRGECVVDVADIDGTFEGTLTVRERLILRPSGRVSGHIRYREIVIEPGGMLSGDIGQMDMLAPVETSSSRLLRQALFSGAGETANSEPLADDSADRADAATK